MKALPTFYHPHLKEFCIKGQNSESDYNGDVWKKEASLIRKLMKYLKKCPNLKILKIEYEGEKHVSHGDEWNVTYRYLEFFEKEDIFGRIKFPNLEELHFNGFDFDYIPSFIFGDIINKIYKNSPKLRKLCFKVDNLGILDPQSDPEYDKILQKFASEKNVKIEITGTPIYTRSRRILEVKYPWSGFRIYNADGSTQYCRDRSNDEQHYF